MKNILEKIKLDAKKNEKEHFQLRKFYIFTNKNHITGFLDPSPGRIYNFLSAETQICGNMEGFRDLIGEFLQYA